MPMITNSKWSRNTVSTCKFLFLNLILLNIDVYNRLYEVAKHLWRNKARILSQHILVTIPF
jgi:hypothetical protein